MANFNDFHMLNTPLQGTNLIEASAGTGKTYTVTGLFLRLILEQGFPVDKILVVTFTEAATQELKERIQTRLREALNAFCTGTSDDSFLSGLVERTPDKKKCISVLKQAIRSFDLAAIHTIHGFCKRMLTENAFESNSLFDTELVPDQTELKKEIVNDFFRKHFHHTSFLFAGYAISKHITPSSLLALISNVALHQELIIIPDVDIPDPETHEKKYIASFERIASLWLSCRQEVEKVLLTDKGLNRNKYRKSSVSMWMPAMDQYLESNPCSTDLFEAFQKFTSSVLAVSVKKGLTPPEHPFFDLCETHKKYHEELMDVFGLKLLGMKKKLFDYVQKGLENRKKEKNIFSFDDLLLKLHAALFEHFGEYLSENIRNRFSAALIDEFQDTDQIQYAIFNKIFNTPQSILFFIGDPKQAIYGFRGADIFAYMNAARHAESRYTLKKNWRSEKGLITAVNTLFNNPAQPFVFNEIPFIPVSPAPRECEILKINGNSDPPFQLWFLNSEKLSGTNKAVTKEAASQNIPVSVAAEISRLLDLASKGFAKLGERPVKEGDIAVLVRKNAEALVVQQALVRLNIPSVLFSTGNLFDTDEAVEFQRIISAVVFPDNESLIRVALSTKILGFTGEELERNINDDDKWENRLMQFRAYHDMWKNRGFIRMFKYMLQDHGIMPRQMACPDGERRCTNILHLGEVLQKMSIEKKTGMEGLLKWFTEQMDPGTTRIEEYQIRLESDENAVKIVTMHKSKGLEYPIVFCPFTWAGSAISNRAEHVLFHEENDNQRLILDIGSTDWDKNRTLAEKELLAENLRILYVAMTRAKNRCYMVWGRINGVETSAPAFLLHHSGDPDIEHAVKNTSEKFKKLGDWEILKELETVCNNGEGTIHISEMSLETGPALRFLFAENESMMYRDFSGAIHLNWRISSFSSLVSGHHGFHSNDEPEIADYDVNSIYEDYTTAGTVAPENRHDIFSFPKGSKPGTLLHDIYEHLDFSETDSRHLHDLVAEKLDAYGFEQSWHKIVCDMITNVLSTRPDPDQPDLSLEKITKADRLNELEFYFPLKKTTPQKMKHIFSADGGRHFSSNFSEQIGRLDFSPTKGFMKGFIDLVFKFNDTFYIVDWKSNFLGNRIEDYDQPALLSAMEKEFYILQYHIYTVALNQYLKKRMIHYDYEKNFGGVFYIFLRGVDPKKGPNYGIFRDRPEKAFIEKLADEWIYNY